MLINASATESPSATASRPDVMPLLGSPLTIADTANASTDVFEAPEANRVDTASIGSARTPSQSVKVFYRFGKADEIKGLVEARGLAFDNVSQYVDNDLNLIGDGIYLAESPVTAQMYGNHVVEVWVDQKLIDDGHFERFGGIGRDWWLGQIDDILETKGLDLNKVASGGYKGDADKENILKDIGIYYRPFKGSQLSRVDMEKLIRYSEPDLKSVFQEVLDNRLYLWNTTATGELTATEYTDDGFEVGPLDRKYCTAANQETFKTYPVDEAGAIPMSTDYEGFNPSGFDNDLRVLADKSIIYRVWRGYKDFKLWLKSCFK